MTTGLPTPRANANNTSRPLAVLLAASLLLNALFVYATLHGQTAAIYSQMSGTMDQYILDASLLQALQRSPAASNQTRTAAVGIHPTTPHNPQHKFAYAFVLGGCSPEQEKNAYRGFLYNVWIAARILRQQNSTADVVLFVQLAYKSSASALLAKEEDVSHQLGVEIRYIPRTKDESFYQITYDKFRVLQLTEYDRVLFMDGDVMPLGNLDYLFTLSMQGVLQENYIIGTYNEPSNAGFFLITPHEGDWERMSNVILWKEENTPPGGFIHPHWGWGSPIVGPHDWWEQTNGKKGTGWTFRTAYNCQGLLYHWTKYVQRRVTIKFGGHYKHIVPHPTNESDFVRLDDSSGKLLDAYMNPIRLRNQGERNKYCKAWSCDWQHFTGKYKPWMKRMPEDLYNASLASPETRPTDLHEAYVDTYHLWYAHFMELNRDFSLKIDMFNWGGMGRAPLGLFAKGTDIRDAGQRAREAANSTQVVED
jgi:hypothetical protein